MTKTGRRKRMVKKLGDFTLNEIVDICHNHNCDECPFFGEDYSCMIGSAKFAHPNNREWYLNKEIEV